MQGCGAAVDDRKLEEVSAADGRRSLCRDDTQRRNGELADRGSSIYREAGEAVSVQAAAAEKGQAAEGAYHGCPQLPS